MTNPEELAALEPLVGRWRMIPGFVPDPADAPHAITTFEWLAGKRFLIQRWEVDHPEAPDGIAIIGANPSNSAYLQHYFDSRGVTRHYTMSLADDVWALERIAESPDFSQRFTGQFSDDRRSIVGAWEISHDNGASWSIDFDLTYIKQE
jgi:hypothetical protein